jgi:flagellar protein FliS
MHQTALKAYQQAEQNFLVDGTNAHGLVQILFNELAATLERAEIAMSDKDFSAKAQATTKALSILFVLASTLDFKRGGEIAVSLSQFYDWARRTIIGANRDNKHEPIKNVRREVEGLADAWKQIANAA